MSVRDILGDGPMTFSPGTAGERARAAFEHDWRRGEPWALDAELDRTSRAHQLALIDDRRYRRVLEIGCAAGGFTELLAGVADGVVALDIAPSAIDHARQRGLEQRGVRLVVANIMEYDVAADGPWDLVVMSETIYCLGWLYPLFDVGWLVSHLHDAQEAGGRLLMANTYGHQKDYLLRPWLIDTYRDLFLHVGYEVEREEILRGAKGGEDFEILMSLFVKPATAAERGVGRALVEDDRRS